MYQTKIMKSRLHYVLPLLFSLLTCGAAVLLTPGVSGTRQSDSLDRPCPGETLVYNCSEANTSLTWIVSGDVLHTYVAGTSSTFTTDQVDSVTGATARAMEVGIGARLTSTLTIEATGNDGVLIECTDSGGDTVSIPLNLAAPPVPPEYICTLTGQRRLRLEWINNNMNVDDSVDEYRACSCTGRGCPCVPTACGDLSNNCVREFEADQVHNFMFTAVNCGSQESTASALTVDARASAPSIDVNALYSQSTEGLNNVAVTWDTVAPISVPVGCVEGIAQQYNVRCGDNFERLGLLQSTICNSGMCHFESPATTGCILSVDSVNVMGTRTTTQDIPGTTPLTVAVSNGRTISCNMTCDISYGTDPNFETLPNTIISGPAGVELTQLVLGKENFYVVSADIGSQLRVQVKGSLQAVPEVLCEQPSYTANKNDGVAHVCLTQDTVTVDDTTTRTQSVTFEIAANDHQSINITIIPDSEWEPIECFDVNLQIPATIAGSVVPSTVRVCVDDVGVHVPVNDTIIEGALFIVPIYISDEDQMAIGSDRVLLCYEINGKSSQWFNLVTNKCTSVNAYYASVNEFRNIIERVAIQATDDAGNCREIEVNVDGCSTTLDGMAINIPRYEDDGIRIRQFTRRVRVAVPNCAELSLVMWITCETHTFLHPYNEIEIIGDLIRFDVLRGLNFGHFYSHGLIGQFWNVPVDLSPFNGTLRDGSSGEKLYEINFSRDGSPERVFIGYLHQLTWEQREGPCLYVGNRQGGPLYEVLSPNDPVIEGTYADYIVAGAFDETGFTFSRFDGTQC